MTLDACMKISRSKSIPVARYSSDGVLLEVYFNARMAAAMTGADTSNISKVCKNQRHTAAGSVWKYYKS